jgi:hypothetical protein
MYNTGSSRAYCNSSALEKEGEDCELKASLGYVVKPCKNTSGGELERKREMEREGGRKGGREKERWEEERKERGNSSVS